MFGPRIALELHRKDRGEGRICVELGPPVDEEQAAVQFAEWFRNNRTRLYMTRACPICEDTEREWLREQGNAEDSFLWCIFCDNTLIGSVGIGDVDLTHRRGRYGIMIGRQEYRDRGIGTACGVSVLEYAFNNIVAEGLNKVSTEVVVKNIRNMRVSQKVGFRQIGIARQQYWFQGQWFDAWLGEITKDAWEQQREEKLSAAAIKTLNLYPQTEIEGFEPIRPDDAEEDIQ